MTVEDIAEEPSLAVSSLRSRFEQLAAASSSQNPPKSGNPEAIARLSRPRAASNQGLNIDTTIHVLRGSSSSSDLKTDAPEAATSAMDFQSLARRRPPPPTNPNDSNVQVVAASSELKPMETDCCATSSMNFKSAALKRPPPPPPPSRLSKVNISPIPSPLNRPVPLPPSSGTSGDVAGPSGSPPRDIASLREKFNGNGVARPAAAMRSPVPPVPPRPTFLVSHSPKEAVMDSPTGVSETEGDSLRTENIPPIPPLPRRSTPSPDLRNNSLEEKEYTSDSSSSLPPPIPPPRSSRLSGLPPPPPRHRTSRSPNSGSPESLAPSSSAMGGLPPPLPIRRPTAAPDSSPSQISPPPRRSTMARPAMASALPPELNGIGFQVNGYSINETPAPSPIDRKPHLGRHPPPPTRTIALGDKLPAARRVPSGSGDVSSDDEEAGEEDSPATRAADTLPDTSSASRRLPALTLREGSPPPCLSFHPHSGCVIASGPNFVVAHVHHVKIYNLEIQDAPIYDLEMKQLGMKDAKILCMEFRPSLNKADRGCVVWFGTKDGSLLEMDIRKGQITGTKPAAHLHPVTHMFRRGRSLVTLDESGKALIFSPDPEHLDQDVSLIHTVPRAVRTTDKNDFVRFLDGKLWTASRNEHNGAAPGKMPIIRVFDIFNPASPGKSIIPCDQCGQVLTATILPSEPDKVYVGHEEGYVSIWSLDSDDGWPQCIEVSKVSTSDVLCLEGVNERLWAGSRNGMISAYDVSQKPWVMTNCWKAHLNLPVLRIFVNYRAIEACQKLCVVSLGRDEAVKLWDGLLGVDWVEKELVQNESSFSTFHDIRALVVSWNCDAARPDSLNSDARNSSFFSEVFSSVPAPPDIISFSFQEVIDLESRKMTAKNVLLGSKKKDSDALSDRVTGAYKRWHDRLVIEVKAAYGPLGVEYTAVSTESLVGLFSCIFLRNTKEFVCREKQITAIKRGMGGRYGNKGAVIAKLVIADSSICIINCHLAAGQHALKQRNADLAAILEEKGIFDASPFQPAYVRGGDGSMVLDHEFVLLNGDLNYRIDVNRMETYHSAFRSGDLSGLLAHDQLIQQLEHNKTFRLRGFREGPITFFPTYKYDPRSDEYDTSEKRRTPAWCDRILWRSRVPSRMQQLEYRRYEVNVSDHRPISASFIIKVKNVDPQKREGSKAVVESAWADKQVQFLEFSRAFYVRQALI